MISFNKASTYPAEYVIHLVNYLSAAEADIAGIVTGMHLPWSDGQLMPRPPHVQRLPRHRLSPGNSTGWYIPIRRRHPSQVLRPRTEYFDILHRDLLAIVHNRSSVMSHGELAWDQISVVPRSDYPERASIPAFMSAEHRLACQMSRCRCRCGNPIEVTRTLSYLHRFRAGRCSFPMVYVVGYISRLAGRLVWDGNWHHHGPRHEVRVGGGLAALTVIWCWRILVRMLRRLVRRRRRWVAVGGRDGPGWRSAVVRRRWRAGWRITHFYTFVGKTLNTFLTSLVIESTGECYLEPIYL